MLNCRYCKNAIAYTNVEQKEGGDRMAHFITVRLYCPHYDSYLFVSDLLKNKCRGYTPVDAEYIPEKEEIA